MRACTEGSTSLKKLYAFQFIKTLRVDVVLSPHLIDGATEAR